MIDNITSTDVGKRVMSKDWPPGTKDYGTLVRFSLGVPYVKWDYQPVQDAPYPTSGMLLDWSDEPKEAVVTEDDDAGAGDVLAAILGMAEAVVDSASDSDDEFEGEGGSFGGGGASGDF